MPQHVDESVLEIADALRGDGRCRGAITIRASSPAPSGSSVPATAAETPLNLILEVKR